MGGLFQSRNEDAQDGFAAAVRSQYSSRQNRHPPVTRSPPLSAACCMGTPAPDDLGYSSLAGLNTTSTRWTSARLQTNLITECARPWGSSRWQTARRYEFHRQILQAPVRARRPLLGSGSPSFSRASSLVGSLFCCDIFLSRKRPLQNLCVKPFQVTSPWNILRLYISPTPVAWLREYRSEPPRALPALGRLLR